MAAIGDVVLYGVSSKDVQSLTKREPIARPGDGKYPSVGDVLPATVVALGTGVVNLQVLFNGSGDFWARNVALGTAGTPGTYWPRVWYG